MVVGSHQGWKDRNPLKIAHIKDKWVLCKGTTWKATAIPAARFHGNEGLLIAASPPNPQVGLSHLGPWAPPPHLSPSSQMAPSGYQPLVPLHQTLLLSTITSNSHPITGRDNLFIGQIFQLRVGREVNTACPYGGCGRLSKLTFLVG